eukprot:g27756.t1
MYQDPEYQQPFTQTPVRLSVDDRVYIGITVTGMDLNQFVVTLGTCWTTPDSNSSSLTTWGLVNNQQFRVSHAAVGMESCVGPDQ